MSNIYEAAEPEISLPVGFVQAGCTVLFVLVVVFDGNSDGSKDMTHHIIISLYPNMNTAPENINSYQNAPVVDQMEEEEITVPDYVQSRRSRPLYLALGAVCVFAAMLAFMPSSGTPPAFEMEQSVVPLRGSSSTTTSTTTSIIVSACTFDECALSRCDAEAAPYTCLFHNGGVHGGCSPVPWMLGTCTTQCDVSDCDSLAIPDSTKDCNQKCPEKWCAMGRVCEGEAPYQCTNGASAFGCSDDAYHWTFRTSEPACSSCCDGTTCE
jgi:hypothetical protein